MARGVLQDYFNMATEQNAYDARAFDQKMQEV
jgi:hypothetical protein